MTFQNRLKFLILHVQKIGFFTTVSYIVQRLLKRKGQLIGLHLRGLSHTVYLRNKTYDTNIFYQIFVQEDLFLNYEEDIATVVDCGANIGLATLYFQREFPNAAIIAIEPENENYNLLLKNTGNYSNVSALRIGVFDEDCDLSVIDIGEGEASYRLARKPTKGKVIQKIPCRSIDSLMEEFGIDKIDILKMDIEGSEKECLLSPKTEWLRKTKYLLMEIHENIHPGLTQQVSNKIESTGTSFVTSKNGEYTLIKNISVDFL
ncbi:MAG: FkbM family methyltransferase [Ginsengibacter sp.]